MANDARKISINKSKSRKMSAYDQFRANGTAPNLYRRSKSNQELKVEINESQLNNRRRSSGHTFFAAGAPNEVDNNDETDNDYRVRFRQIMRQIYAEQEKEKAQIKQQYQRKLNQRLGEQQQEHRSKVLTFIRYIATEHESLLQILIFLPLIVTAFYIVVIEKGSLVNRID